MSKFILHDATFGDVELSEASVQKMLSRASRGKVSIKRTAVDSRLAWIGAAAFLATIALIGTEIKINNQLADDGTVVRRHYVKILALELPVHKTTYMDRSELIGKHLLRNELESSDRITSINERLHAKIYEQNFERLYGIKPVKKSPEENTVAN